MSKLTTTTPLCVAVSTWRKRQGSGEVDFSSSDEEEELCCLEICVGTNEGTCAHRSVERLVLARRDYSLNVLYLAFVYPREHKEFHTVFPLPKMDSFLQRTYNTSSRQTCGKKQSGNQDKLGPYVQTDNTLLDRSDASQHHNFALEMSQRCVKRCRWQGRHTKKMYELGGTLGGRCVKVEVDLFQALRRQRGKRSNSAKSGSCRKSGFSRCHFGSSRGHRTSTVAWPRWTHLAQICLLFCPRCLVRSRSVKTEPMLRLALAYKIVPSRTKEQFVKVPVLLVQFGTVEVNTDEQIELVRLTSRKEIVEARQLVPQERVHEHVVELTVVFLVPSVNEKIADVSQAIYADRVAEQVCGFFCPSDQRGNREGALASASLKHFGLS